MAPRAEPRTTAPAAFFVVASALAGCVHDYHPERRPETSYALLREDLHPVVVLRGSARALASATVPEATSTPPQPAAPQPVPERWTEHAEATACDRALTIDASGAQPVVSITPCDPEDTTVTRLVTRSRAGDLWVLRADGDAGAPREKCLEYRLRRRDEGDFCGDLVAAAGCGPARPPVPVCFHRESDAQVPASSVPEWLAGAWVQQTDGAPCDDGVRVEAEKGELRAIAHGCFAVGHFDTSRLRTVLDGDTGVELFDGSPDGETRHYRLTRADDGSLSGEITVYPPKPATGERPTIKGVRWVRP